jgi:hypothetical protein
MVARLMRRGAAIIVALAGVYIVVIRPWHLRWGATDNEVGRAMPGDDIVPHPHLTATRAVMVNASARKQHWTSRSAPRAWSLYGSTNRSFSMSPRSTGAADCLIATLLAANGSSASAIAACR